MSRQVSAFLLQEADIVVEDVCVAVLRKAGYLGAEADTMVAGMSLCDVSNKPAV